MKKKIIVILIFSLAIALIATGLVACKDKNEDTIDGPTVSFDLNYPNPIGTVESQTVAKGGKAKMPTAPSRPNFVVRNWYKDTDLNTIFDFDTETITEDITLYAGWTSTLYHIAGNFTGYEAKLEEFRMNEMVGKDGWFELTIELTEENRDQTYDGHYYKVTNGTWDANGCWGTDNYALQPAPVSPTGGGLGSIFIAENRVLKVIFDSENKVIYDDSMVRSFDTPRIYGDFNADMERGNNWSLAEGEALTLTDSDGDGIFTGLYKIPAYTGDSEGYLMAVAISEKYFIDQWGNRWGVEEQYKFDGTPAGMAGTSVLEVEEETIYEFIYNSNTNVTTVTPVEAGEVQNLVNPTIYGDFSGWQYEGSKAITLTPSNDEGMYVGFAKLPAYDGDDENGYSLAVAISKKLYDDAWGIRWGIEEQYKFDGTPAGMGGISNLKPTEETIYEFIYNSNTNVTTVTAVKAGEVQNLAGPTIYGDFNGWQYEGGDAVKLVDDDGDGIFEGTVQLEAYSGDGDGYMLALAISKKLYDDAWGIRWGIEEQYKFNGEPAGMGGLSYLKPTETVTYKFSYDSSTHITTVTPL